MSKGDDQELIGAMAFYPTETYCALTTIRHGEPSNGNFSEPIDWTRHALIAGDQKSAFKKAVSFFTDRKVKLAGLGVSLYGVVKNNEFIQCTQKGWEQKFDVWEKLCEADGEGLTEKNSLVCQTDAAAGAIAEYLWGAGKEIRYKKELEKYLSTNDQQAPDKRETQRVRSISDQDTLAYFKILDGIGSGVILAGRSWEGALHPEMGHIPIRRERTDSFRGICPNHDDCVEGLASRSAMIGRLASYKDLQSLQSLDDKPEHEIWKYEAYYLAELALTAQLVLAPQKIVFEGNVIRNHLMPKIRESFASNLYNYPSQELIGNQSNKDDHPNKNDNLIVSGDFLGPEASLLGGLELARRRAKSIRKKTSLIGNENIKTIEGTNPRLEYTPKDTKFDQSIDEMLGRAIIRPQRTKEKQDRITVVRRQEKKWIFGLSITETIEWALATATEGKIDDQSIMYGPLCESFPRGLMPIKDQDPIYLQTVLRDGLLRLYESNPEIFYEDSEQTLPRNIEGVGVSTIGVVNPETWLLESIARKPWLPLFQGGSVVDFSDLFHVEKKKDGLLFPCIEKVNKVIVQNDAPARCLTEYLYGFDDGERPKSLLYLAVGEGVNGAAVSEGDLPHMLRHPEMGHCLPVLHRSDREANLAEITGCPAHIACFEGVASNARFRRQYGSDIWGLPDNHVAWDQAAYYFAQLAMTGVLNFSPARVIFGGQMVNGPKGLLLLDKIQREFKEANRGYLQHYSTLDAIRKLIGRASFGDIVKPISALTLACLAAFGMNRSGKALTVKELSGLSKR